MKYSVSGIQYATRTSQGVVLALALGTALLASGCDENQYRRAAVATKDFAIALEKAQEAEITLYRAGKLDASEHLAMQGAFDDLADAGKELNAAVLAGKSKPEALMRLQAALESSERLIENDVARIKNEEARQQVLTYLLVARTSLGTVAAVMQ